MNRQEFLLALNNVIPSTNIVLKIKQIYECTVPSEVEKVISFNTAGAFLEGKTFCRLLCFNEISKASEELHVNFKQHGLIPFFDIEDNNFIVFNFKSLHWEKFNIVDEVSYEEKKNLKDILC